MSLPVRPQLYTSNEKLKRWGPFTGPDARRTILQEFTSGHKRDTDLVNRVLDLPANEVAECAGVVLERYSTHHPELEAAIAANGRRALLRAGMSMNLDSDRLLLLGAYFSNEYATEAAALTNPSVVEHPDQNGLSDHQVRAAISLRAVGEGHVSSITFAACVLDPLNGPTSSPRRRPQITGKRLDDGADPVYVGPWSHKDEPQELPLSEDKLEAGYTVEFPRTSDLSQRLLYPGSLGEREGMEDARFVKMEDGPYYATYTALDDGKIKPRLLISEDLRVFESRDLYGSGAKGKGMALFPQKVNGSYLALSRGDGHTNSLTTSDDLRTWNNVTPLSKPDQAWNLSVIGNAGSPHLTEAGWLVVTHGVGPLRTYALGAMLLDKEDPSVVLGQLKGPLLSPNEDESDGYVPNVVYSCGTLVSQGTLWIAYGISDRATAFASIDVDDLLELILP